MLVYPSGIDVSSAALRHLSQRLREHRRAIGTRWRRLPAGRQALLVLAHQFAEPPGPQLSAERLAIPPREELENELFHAADRLMRQGSRL